MLEDYKKKRGSNTPEPTGSTGKRSGPLRFVVHHHMASHEHFDLRLEARGALVSWAIPKMPSYDPTVKRMAVLVEDHPLDYADFEGVIPKGQYGGGEVVIWDEGIYTPDEEGKYSWTNRAEADARILAELEAGKISFTLMGTKLSGSWALVKTKDNWLLLKHKDAWADPVRDSNMDIRSVRTGVTYEDLREGRTRIPLGLENLPGVQSQRLVQFKPMLPTEAKEPFDNPDWTFEPKLDGIRIIATGEEGRVRMWTRGDNDCASRFPALADQLSRLPFRTWAVDGELLRTGADGRTNFTDLMTRFLNQGYAPWVEDGPPIEFCAFDVLHLDGWDLTGCTLADRLKVLRSLGFRSRNFRLIDTFPQHGKVVYQHCVTHGFEGVVAKKLNSKYKPGVRDASWQKVKHQQSGEFIVGGFARGEGGRSATFGSLLLGQKQPDGSYLYVGSVGTGFDDQALASIKGLLKDLAVKESPFSNAVDDKPLADVTFVKPLLWLEVKYQEIGSAGHLRFPVFLRVRPDLAMPPSDMVPEPASPDAEPVVDVPITVTSKQVSVSELLASLMEIKKDGPLEVEGNAIPLSNLDKVLFEGNDRFNPVTKRELIAYFVAASPYMLPHLHNRPISWVRFPNGISGQSFYQKHWEQKPLPYLEEVDVWSGHNGKAVRYLMVNNLSTLVWLAQLAAIEIHPWYSRIDPEPGVGADFATSEETLDASVLNYPDFMVFDLDPYIYSGQEAKGAEPELNQDAFKIVVEQTLELKQIVEQIGLKLFAKTTGKTGLHLFAPIERDLDYDAVRAMALTFGQQMVRKFPRLVTLDWAVGNRTGKIFFDYNQNVMGKTLAATFSTRPVAGAPVSWPVTWDQLAELYPTDFRIETVMERLSGGDFEDPWADILKSKTDLRKLLGG